MQQLVACLQRGTDQQQASLLLVVVDVGFHRGDIKAELGIHGGRQQGKQAYNESQYLIIILLHLLRHICRYTYLNVRCWQHCATNASCISL